jgi:hypothetical protein
MKNFSIARNIPFVDTKGCGFHFQRYNKSIWIEFPFVAIHFRIC